MLFAFLFAVYTTSVCSGQICDLGSIYECMKPTDLDSSAAMQQEQCFTSAGCTVPKWSPEAADSCIQQIHMNMHTSVQTCVSSKFPSLTISLYNNNGQSAIANQRADQWYKMVNASCQNADAATNVEQCLRNISRPWPKRFGLNMTERCVKKKRCMDSLPDNCTSQMKTLKNQICSCARSEILGNSLSILGQLKACGSATTTPTMTSGQSMSNNFVEKVKVGLKSLVKGVEDAMGNAAKLMMQRDLEDAVKMMCIDEKWDVCSMISVKNGV